MKRLQKKLQEKFVGGLYSLFECYTNFYKYAYPENAPPYTNEEGAETLLKHFFEYTKDNIYEYLCCSKEYFKEKYIDTRHNRVEYGASDTFSNEEHLLCINFLRITKEKIFQHILPVTVDLKKATLTTST